VSAFNFGRFGLDVDNERGVTRLNQSGDESSFDLVVKGVDRDAWRALAQQVTALAGVQPVAWTTEPWVDGWYEVRSVRCDLEVDLRHSQAFRAQINARRLPHHQALDIEATLTGAARTNTPGGVTANYYYCVPNDATTLNYGHGSLTTDTRTGPGGTARVIGGTALSGRYVRWTCTPGDYFAMAPKVQFDGVTVIGRRATTDPLSASIDNGLIKVGAVTGANTLRFTAPASTNANWGTPVAVDLGVWDGISVLTPMDPDSFTDARVVRESAESCVLRWRWYSAGVVRFVDVALRRGSPVAEILISQESGYTGQQFGIAQASCTTVHSTRSLRSSTYEGNFLLTLSDPTTTQDSAAGLQYASSAADQYRCGVGVVIEGGSAPTINAEGRLRDFFFGGQMVLEQLAGVRA
jgi:hypothetical protein